MSLPNEIWFEITIDSNSFSYMLVNEQFYQFFKIRYNKMSVIELIKHVDNRNISNYEYMKILVDKNNHNIIQYLENCISNENDSLNQFKNTHNICYVEKLLGDSISPEYVSESNRINNLIYDLRCEYYLNKDDSNFKRFNMRYYRLDIELKSLHLIYFLLDERVYIIEHCRSLYNIGVDEVGKFDDIIEDCYCNEHRNVQYIIMNYLKSVLPYDQEFMYFSQYDRHTYIKDIVRNFPELELENSILNKTLSALNVNTIYLEHRDYIYHMCIYLDNIDLYIELWNKLKYVYYDDGREIFHAIINRVSDNQLDLMVDTFLTSFYCDDRDSEKDIYAEHCEYISIPRVTELIYMKLDIVM